MYINGKLRWPYVKGITLATANNYYLEVLTFGLSLALYRNVDLVRICILFIYELGQRYAEHRHTKSMAKRCCYEKIKYVMASLRPYLGIILLLLHDVTGKQISFFCKW